MRVLNGAVLAVLICLVTACGDSPTGRETPEPTPTSPTPTTLEAVGAPAAAVSGEPVSIRFRVTDRTGAGLAGVAVTATALDGAVAAASAETAADGTVTFVWTLADVDARQVLTASVGSLQRAVSVTSTPRIVALTPAAPAPLPLGDSTGLTVTARTGTGRIVPWTKDVVIMVDGDARAFSDLGVVRVSGDVVVATGPGSATLRAVSGEHVSEPVTVTVPRDRPIVTGAEVVAGSASAARVRGYDLDAVTAVSVDGKAVTPGVRGSRELIIELPPAPSGCDGRSAAALAIDGAYYTNGALLVKRARANELNLQVGEIRRLGASSDLCLLLPAIPGAEYAVALMDPRRIVAARTVAEDPAAFTDPWVIAASDRSASTPAMSRVAAGMQARAKESDIVRINVGASASVTPEPFYQFRSTPWKAGDGFSIPDTGNANGHVFFANDKFAVATLDRDSAYRIPSRVRNLQEALTAFGTYGEPFLRKVFVDEWPATTKGSGQVLIIIGDAFAAGYLNPGTGVESRGSFIGIDPAVFELQLTDNLFIQENVLFHEMAHNFQDRYIMRRCIDFGDCGWGFWEHRWAVEGGAELLTEHMLQRAAGKAFDANARYEDSYNFYGFIFYYGSMQYKYHSFDSGYGSASWVLRDFVQRLVNAGKPIDDAFSTVARGAFEGWYGHQRDGGARPGLQRRMSDALGTQWDPVEAGLQAILTVAADDRTTIPELQVPFLRNMWERISSAADIELGAAGSWSQDVRGQVFAHYRITDPAGLGGSVKLGVAGNAPEWALVRIR